MGNKKVSRLVYKVFLKMKIFFQELLSHSKLLKRLWLLLIKIERHFRSPRTGMIFLKL